MRLLHPFDDIAGRVLDRVGDRVLLVIRRAMRRERRELLTAVLDGDAVLGVRRETDRRARVPLELDAHAALAANRRDLGLPVLKVGFIDAVALHRHLRHVDLRLLVGLVEIDEDPFLRDP
jgi:hypothetical protein